jgi:RHH-type rel operon transcriptional repressor/antitoxin RelB
MLCVRLDPAVERRLENLARQTGHTKTYYIAELVQRHFAEIETCYLQALEKEKRPTKKGALSRQQRKPTT